jgi:phospholipid/cholesterol/gamma-HCH transport system ATP-binding protein
MIAIAGLHKRFKSNHVLRGIDLEIKDGETIAIIGGSGTGKSILLKNIIGLVKPDSGDVCIDGDEITVMDDRALLGVQKKIGYLFQDAALFDSMTIEDNVGFGLRTVGKVKDEAMIHDRVNECLAMVGLKGVNKQLPGELSGGMRKRAGLARAIAYKPKYLLYDEPTTGLDPIMSDVINDLILRMQEQIKVTSIVVTHDMKSAYKVANRIAMLYQGKIIEIGSPDEIKNSKNPVVHQFVEGLSQGPITLDLAYTARRI